MTERQAPTVRQALRDLLIAIEADIRVKRGDYFHERKAARAALARLSALQPAKETKANAPDARFTMFARWLREYADAAEIDSMMGGLDDVAMAREIATALELLAATPVQLAREGADHDRSNDEICTRNTRNEEATA